MEPAPLPVLPRFDPAGLEILERDECFRLLDQGGVGRIALAVGGSPFLLPINFVCDGDRIVMRTAEGRLSAAAVAGAEACFEADETRNVDHTGWSVVVTGSLRELAGDEHLLSLPLRAWAPAPRDRWVALVMRVVSGRRLGPRR